MSSPVPEFDNPPGDVLQEQHDQDAYNTPAIPVCIDDPVRTQELPARSGAFYTVGSVGTGDAKNLARDPRRKHATVIGLTEDILLGSTQANARQGARVPAVVPFVITAIDEVWAASAEATTDISVITEQWAD